MKNFSIILFKILYSIFAAICTLFVAYNIFIVSAHSLFTDNGFHFQIILYIILSLALVIGFWSLIFVKIKPPAKILIFLLLLGIQLNYLKIAILLPSVNKVFKMELCVDMGICPEGIKIKNDNGVLFEINKGNCVKYGYKWDEQNRNCDMEIEARTCYKQGYEWNIREGKCSHKIIKDW